METCSVVLTFESVDKILWCDHSNEISSPVILHGTIMICFSLYNILNYTHILIGHYLRSIRVQMHRWCQGEFVKYNVVTIARADH